MTKYTIDIRERRQATFPSDLLQKLGIGVGDSLEIIVEREKAILKPKKQVALDALKEIQKAFGHSNVSEKEMQKEIDKKRVTP